MQNKRIAQLHNTHKGEKCIIIGNGPSLNSVPLEFLKSNTTFGTNKIFLMEGFTPTYYVSVNPLVIDQSYREIVDMNAHAKFIRENTIIYDELLPLHSMRAPAFSYDPSRYIYEGHTVTFVCMQLAFFMGFTEVGLVGVDHRFTYIGKPNEECIMNGDDPNHFNPDYFKGHSWNNPDLEKSEQAYELAEQAFSSMGRKIYNLTLDSALEVFERMDIEQWKP